MRRRKNKEKNEEEAPPIAKKEKSRFSNFIDDVFMSVREFKRKKLSETLSTRQRKKERTRRSRIAPREVFGLGVQGLLQQYQTYLKTYVPPDVTRAAFDKNMEKNRYKDVVCIDQTRVILKNTEQDYIHASYVRGDPFVNPFICTQGPMNSTVNDFWIMIMQEKVSHIFMLCNIIECGKSRCAQYWPSEVGATAEHAGVVIRNISVENDDSTLVLTKLEAEGRGERLTIKHLRWKNWPDKGVPSSVFAPFRLLKMARQSTARPTVVHCSAGIGRTGCIVAIEMAVQILLAQKPLDLVRAVQQLRTMRMSAVQTDTQFVYVARCLLTYASTCGVMQNRPALIQKAAKFESEYEAYFAAKASAERIVTAVENEKADAKPNRIEQDADDTKQSAEAAKASEDTKQSAEVAKVLEESKQSAEVAKVSEGPKPSAEVAKAYEDPKQGADVAKSSENLKKGAEVAKSSENLKKGAEVAKFSENLKKGAEGAKVFGDLKATAEKACNDHKEGGEIAKPPVGPKENIKKALGIRTENEPQFDPLVARPNAPTRPVV
ncbi:unnamed protein product [Toxocara canis]|uniref:Tyrosine-protein phosphatase non-receptor type 9 n=1 Tax=Toxocara canis TaxID=6265 RepID=A0A183UBB8_TOXCA|nr:unnamed protein product [Toxocara canis]